MKASLIIAAGGSGSRFQKTLNAAGAAKKKQSQDVPPSKLFFKLAGKPLLEHTLQAFQQVPQISETVIAAPKDAIQAVQAIIKRRQWKNIRITEGGKTRAESVYKALLKTNPRNNRVWVHDGARPFISKEAAGKLLTASGKFEAVLLAKKVVPTIKEGAADGTVKRTVDRNVLFEAETPQVLDRQLLLRAYKTVPQAMLATDESSLAEAVGVKTHLVTHDGWNPKITSYQDFELAEAVMARAITVRTGFGRDTHRLVEKRKMILGGIHIPFEKGPLGHSDGDALLHAVTDAILGAIGAGDIGDWFSDQDPRHKNIASSKMLRAVFEDAVRKGYGVTHVDTVTILQRPKLAAYKPKMKANIAKILNLPLEAVSVKAKTAEGLGPEGEGLAVTCEALVTLNKAG